MFSRKAAYDGKEVATGVDHGKEVYASSSPSHAHTGKEVASPAYTDGSSRPDNEHNAPIPIEHDTEKPITSRKSRGLSRKALIIVLALAIVLLLALGLGLGLGLGLKSGSSNTSSSPATTTVTAQPITTTASSTLSSSSSAATPLASTSCPGTNGTTYTSSGHMFQIFCENDIHASDPQDLGRVYQPSFNACIDSCAAIDTAQARADVSAVYWVDYDAAARGTCWCIGGTSRANNASVVYNPNNNLAWIQS